MVIAKDNNSDVKVTDGNTTATISFAPNTNKRFANVAVVDAKITFFKLQKQSAQTLIFTKARIANAVPVTLYLRNRVPKP